MREVQDHYFREAKKEGYLSRAAYKLIEIADRKKILRPGDRVLDCGCAPGSWLQVAAARVGPGGVVVGIDLSPIKFRAANVKAIEGDFTALEPNVLLALIEAVGRLRSSSSSPAPHGAKARTSGGSLNATSHRFDVILSDMAPSTSGDPGGDHHRSVRLCQSLLDRCGELLRPGGNLVMKVFEGEAYPDLLKRIAEMFESSKGYKPKASRSESAEMYIVATGFKPAATTVKDGAKPQAVPLRRSTGWTNRQA